MGIFGVLVYVVGVIWNNFVFIYFGVGLVFIFLVLFVFFIEEFWVFKSFGVEEENEKKLGFFFLEMLNVIWLFWGFLVYVIYVMILWIMDIDWELGFVEGFCLVFIVVVMI